MKTYIKPNMTVVRLQHHSIICQSGRARALSNSDGIGYGGGGSGDAYTKESETVWDDEW